MVSYPLFGVTPVSSEPNSAAAAHQRHAVLTVHGIRTFGQWQERLEGLVRRESPDIAFLHYHYGFFSSLAFLCPPLRWLTVRRFERSVLRTIDLTQWDRIDIVAHSFGTHIAGWSLRRLPTSCKLRIHTLILAGSVLKPSFPWRTLLNSKRVGRLVNDCGTRDSVLFVNQVVVLFTGMAGRVGFRGLTGPDFRNRFFRYGHSDYFQTSPDRDAFMREWWLPLLTRDEETQQNDERRNTLAESLLTFLANHIAPVKICAWALPLLWLVLWLQESALESRRNLAKLSREHAQNELSEGRILEARLLMDQAFRILPSSDDRVLSLGVPDPPAVIRWRMRHKAESSENGWPTFAAFTPDGRLLVTACGIDVHVWDAQTGHCLHTFNTRTLATEDWPDVRSLVISPDGLVIVVSLPNCVGFFSVLEPTRSEPTIPASAAVLGLASLGTTLAIAEFSKITLVDPRSGHLREFEAPRIPRAIAFTPDDRALVIGCRNGDAAILDLVQGTVGTLPASEDLRGLAFAEPDTLLGASGATVRSWAWQSRTPKAVAMPRHAGPITALQSTRDGRYCVTGSTDGDVRLWDLRSHEGAATLRHDGAIAAIACSPDGQSLFTSTVSGTMTMWRLLSDAELGNLSGHTDAVTCVAAGDRWIVSGSRDKTVRVWSLAGNLQKVLSQREAVMDLAMPPQEDCVACSTADDLVTLWSIPAGDVLCQWSGTGSQLEWSKGGRFLAVANRRSATVLERRGKDLASVGDCAILWDPSRPRITSMAFLRDESSIALADDLGNCFVRRWTTEQPPPEIRLRKDILGQDSSVASAHRSPWLACASGGDIQILSLAEGIMAHTTLMRFSGARNTIARLTFTADDRYLFSVARDDVVRLWSLESQELVLALPGAGPAAIAPSGSTVVTSHSNNALRLWRVKTLDRDALERDALLTVNGVEFAPRPMDTRARH